MFKLSSQYLWQWFLVMGILFTMFNGIDWAFKKADEKDVHDELHSEELDITHQINNNLDAIIHKLDIIIEKLDKKK